MMNAKLKKMQAGIDRLQGAGHEWLPPYVRECCSEAEASEYRVLDKQERATLEPLYKQPVTDSNRVSRGKAIETAKAPMINFERRMRKRYGSRMPETWREMEQEAIARARNDPDYREREGLNQNGPPNVESPT